MKGIARFFVATLAGAGIGAGAALAQRHLMGGFAEVPESFLAPPAPEPTAQAADPLTGAEPVAPPARSAEDVADLDAARIRLRERAAALRAEMEGRAGVP